jgi:hypothetical protein
MPGLFTDMRKMAIAAAVLLVLALLFAEPGGVGGKAVDHEGQSGSVAASSQATAAGRGKGWFSAASEDENAPVIAPAPVSERPFPGEPDSSDTASFGPRESAPQPAGPDAPQRLAPRARG